MASVTNEARNWISISLKILNLEESVVLNKKTKLIIEKKVNKKNASIIIWLHLLLDQLFLNNLD